jgi:hypothetical protein
VLVKKCMHTMASVCTTHPWYHRLQCEWSVTPASVLVLVKSRIGSQSVTSFTVSLSIKYIICLLIHLNYDSSISNKQSRSVREILFVSATNEHQSPCSVKHSKVVFSLFQNVRQCGRPGGNGLCHWWVEWPDADNGGAIRLQNGTVVFDRRHEPEEITCKCDSAQW